MKTDGNIYRRDITIRESTTITGLVMGSIGVAAGLVVGKTVGILGASVLAVRFGVARLPAGVSWGQIVGLAVLGGTGFTVSLFITDLAFTDPALTALSKIGILIGSVTAAVVGYAVLRKVSRPN